MTPKFTYVKANECSSNELNTNYVGNLHLRCPP